MTDPLARVTSFAYDEAHRLLKMTDPRGGVVSNTYDSQNRVTEQTDPAGLTTTFAYTGDNFSSLGGTTTVTEPHGSITIEQYANGFLAEVTKGAGTPSQGTWSYAYDPSTLGTTSATDARGNTTTSAYNATGQLTSTTDPLGHVTSYTYNALQETLTSVTPGEKTTTRTYDTNGNLTSVTDSSGAETQYQYGDSSHPGDLTAVVDPEERTEAITYDSYGDIASRTTSPTAGTNDTTTYSYDTDGEQTCEAAPNATAAGVGCPPAGAPRATDTATRTLDADGELIASTDAAGKTTSYTYDEDGNQTETVDPHGNRMTANYDPDNRVTSEITGAGTPTPSTTKHAYDLPAGSAACQELTGATHCNTSTDANGGVTVDYFDARGNKIATTRPGGQTTRYGFDLDGNRTTVTDASGRVTTFGYDAANRLTTIAYSDGVTPGVKYSYDAEGSRIAMQDGTGITTYTLDPEGRLVSTTDGSGATTQYTYDKAGDVTKLTYPNGKTIVRTYDGARRLTSVTDWLGNTTTFGYDPSGNVRSTGYPNGDAVASTYSPTNAMTGTKAAHGAKTLLAISYGHNENELISVETDKKLSGSTTYTYNAQNELLSAGSSIYSYDPAGNLTVLAATHQEYNTEDELTSSTNGSNTATYAYGAQGERVSSMPSQGPTTKYSYDQAGRLTSVVVSPRGPLIEAIKPSSGPATGGTRVKITGENLTGATAVKFDGAPGTGLQVTSSRHLSVIAPPGEGTVDVEVTTPAGTSPAVAADRYTYTGTAASQVVRHAKRAATLPAPLSYAYNGDGLRTTRTTDETTEHYTWDPTATVPEITSDAANAYIYGPGGRPIEQIDHTETPSYYFHDAIGSTRALLASSGTVTASWTYNAYGSLKKATGAATTPFGFTGGYTDPTTGLIYLIHRNYDPQTGQFLVVDPALSETNAPYSYADGDPINESDLTGQWPSFTAFVSGVKGAVEDAIGHFAGGVVGVAETIYTGVNDGVALSNACLGHWSTYACGIAIQHVGVDVAETLVGSLCVSAGPWSSACAGAVSGVGTFLLDRYGIVAPTIAGHPYTPPPSAPRPGPATAGTRRC